MTDKTTVMLSLAMLNGVLRGGNHLASLIGSDHPPYTATYDDAYAHYRTRACGWNAYEAWCCWKRIMMLAAQLRSEGLDV